MVGIWVGFYNQESAVEWPEALFGDVHLGA
jgi:hypothetical protein